MAHRAAGPTAQVRQAYARRTRHYDPIDPAVLLPRQEFERALAREFRRAGVPGLERCRLLEIGCGNGGNLLSLLRLGARPENLVGNELIAERLAAARAILPPTLRLLPGDAAVLDQSVGQFDVVLISLVFSSILDEGFQHRLADRVWSLVRPGGGVIWYDFVLDNPANPDVRGVPLTRVRRLFPAALVRARRITLAPPLARRVVRWNPSLYALLNCLPILRTHLFCWLPKPDA